jgi:glutamate synthase (NADPH/NADH) large chain
VAKIVEAEGLDVLGWREVPTDDSSLGALSRDAMPTFRQLFIGGASGLELERRAYVIRKRAEHELAPRAPVRTARAEKPSTSQAFPVARSSTRAC